MPEDIGTVRGDIPQVAQTHRRPPLADPWASAATLRRRPDLARPIPSPGLGISGPIRRARAGAGVEMGMHNVEFKAELRDLELARAVCRAIRATWIADLEQTDTYYRVTSGRLKRRECPGEETEYIFYDRPNRTRPKLSHFSIYNETQALERFGTAPLPVWLVVKKSRELWMHGNVRIHLDRVEGLGSFLEFEALVSKDHNLARCHDAIAEMRRAFHPALGEPIDRGYSDLLELDRETPSPGDGPSQDVA